MHAARTGNMSHIRPLPLPNNQPKHDAHDHLRAVFFIFLFTFIAEIHQRIATLSHLVKDTASCAQWLIQTVSQQAAVLFRMWTFSCIVEHPKRLFLSHVDARKGATQEYFSKKEEISFPLESKVDIACSDVCSINSTFWLSVEFFEFWSDCSKFKKWLPPEPRKQSSWPPVCVASFYSSRWRWKNIVTIFQQKVGRSGS